MATVCDMIGMGLIERDTNNDILWTWSYPSIEETQRTLILKKCGLDLHGDGTANRHFRYCHHHSVWYYMYPAEVFDADKLPRVKQFVLVLQTKEFNPEKYEAFGRVLSKSYCKSGTPSTMLHLYLSVVIRGSCTTEENGTFLLRDFDQRMAFAASPLGEVVEKFGLESILIYTAMMLKKRVVVYHHQLDALHRFLRALPAFTWHRQNWDLLYPYMELSAGELSELNSLPFYVAGFCDASVESRIELYDLFINLAATEITIPAHSRESLGPTTVLSTVCGSLAVKCDLEGHLESMLKHLPLCTSHAFAMSKTHKEIAMFLTREAESDLPHQQIIKDLAVKTREILNNLKSLGKPVQENKLVITIEDLKERKFSPALENFLWNLAIAEGFVAT